MLVIAYPVDVTWPNHRCFCPNLLCYISLLIDVHNVPDSYSPRLRHFLLLYKYILHRMFLSSPPVLFSNNKITVRNQLSLTYHIAFYIWISNVYRNLCLREADLGAAHKVMYWIKYDENWKKSNSEEPSSYISINCLKIINYVLP